MTENDYVATATAEKRLREVLAHQFHDAGFLDDLAGVLLQHAEITYLPRKKSVSILLRYPETAPSKVLRQNGSDPTTTAPDGTPIPSDGYPDKATYDEAQLARVYGDGPGPGEPGHREDPPARGVARFGEFVPTATSNESDYFTE